MTIAPDFRKFAAFLNEHEVRYLIVGGYAVAFHGHPRYTKDLDVWIEREPENVDRLLKALQEFGFGSVGLTAADFLEPNKVIQLGNPPIRIDLLTSIDAVEFSACYERRETLDVDGVVLPFIGFAELLVNKRASGRLQDRADLKRLE